MPFSLTRSLLAVFVPGVVGLCSWMLLLVEAVPEARALYSAYPLFFQAIGLSLVIVAGTVFDGLGSRIEARWDKLRAAQFAVEANWWTYLAREVAHEPVGFRYMARNAAVLSFELSMTFATVVFALGLGALIGWTSPWHLRLPVAVGAAGAALAAFFYWSAWDTHELLCETRREVNARMGGLLAPSWKADGSDASPHRPKSDV